MSAAAGKYYEAYDQRYKAIHAKGLRWTEDVGTPLVLETIRRLGLDKNAEILEIGCGEGRDARDVLEVGFRLTAADISPEAVRFCREAMPEHADSFAVIDCLYGDCPMCYDFIYAVAVVHMLVADEDRDAFYRFIREHLTDRGTALICSMGDGSSEMRSDAGKAFELTRRSHSSGPVTVPATSCRMVSFPAFRREIAANGLEIIEEGVCSCPPEFDSLMYALVRASQK